MQGVVGLRRGCFCAGIRLQQAHKARHRGSTLVTTIVGSGAPRANQSRPSRGRAISRRAGGADGFQAAQLEGQGLGHLRGARFVVVGLFGQQQPGFQVGEPGCHHQIVRGQFQAQRLARPLHEGKILVGKRQDRDLGQVDLLARAPDPTAHRSGPHRRPIAGQRPRHLLREAGRVLEIVATNRIVHEANLTAPGPCRRNGA